MSKIWKPSPKKFKEIGFTLTEEGFIKNILVEVNASPLYTSIEERRIQFLGGRWMYRGHFLNITRQSDLKEFIKIISLQNE